MTWSFARARQAAADVRAAPLGSQAVATMRPRGGVGLVRSRAPLSVLLFVAARDGLVTEQDNGGYAVLQRPAASPPIRSGGYQLRLLRWLDRRWDFVLFGGPPLLGLVAGAVAAPFAATRVLGLVAAAAAALWVCAFLAARWPGSCSGWPAWAPAGDNGGPPSPWPPATGRSGSCTSGIRTVSTT